MPGEEIDKSTLEKAISYVSWAESQKEIFVDVKYQFSINLYKTM